MRRTRQQLGFTMIEMIIYLCILAIFLSGVIGLGFTLFSSSYKTKASNEVEDNSVFLGQILSWYIRGANQINSPTNGLTATSLSLQQPYYETGDNDADDYQYDHIHYNTVVFDVSSGVARITINSGTPVPLTNSFVTIASLTFNNTTYSTQTKNTIRIKGLIKSSDSTNKASSSFDLFVNVQ